MVIEELIALLGYDLKGEGNLKRFEAGLLRARTGITNMQAALAGFAGGLAAGLAQEALRGLSQLVTALPAGAIQTGAAFEKLATTLETIEGSADKAKSSLDWIEEFATKTPYDLEQVADAFVKMRAYGLDPMDGSLESIGNAASAMGKSLEQGVEAIADAAQGEFERLKEFSIRAEQAKGMVTLSWQEAGKEVKKTVKKDGSEITKTLREVFDKRFNGAMARQAKTWNGLMANIGDSFTKFKRMIADAGFFDFMKERLARVLDQFERWRTAGDLQRWASNISGAFTGLFSSMERLAWGAQRLWTALDGDKALKPLLVIIGAILLKLAPVLTLIGALILVLEDLAGYFRGDKSAIGWLLDNMAKGWESLKEKVAGVWESIKAAVADGVQNIKADILSSFDFDLSGAGRKIIDSLVAGLAAGAEKVLNFVKDLANQVRGILSGMKIEVDASGAKAPQTQPPRAAPQNDPGGRYGVPLEKRSSLDGLLGRGALARMGGPTNQSVTNQVTVQVAGTNASPQQIGDAVAGALSRSSLKAAYFTGSKPVAA